MYRHFKRQLFSAFPLAPSVRAMATSRFGNCSSCGVQMQSPLWYLDLFYCSRRCAHAAGCRWDCDEIGDCGCTPYAKRRRVLRETRHAMRVMRDVLEENDLMGDFDTDRAHTAAADIELELDQGPGGADEASDVEDETVALRATVAARSEADVLHQLVDSAASLAERERLHAEIARLQAEVDVLRQSANTAAEDARP